MDGDFLWAIFFHFFSSLLLRGIFLTFCLSCLGRSGEYLGAMLDFFCILGGSQGVIMRNTCKHTSILHHCFSYFCSFKLVFRVG